jgi:hypothetical protein
MFSLLSIKLFSIGTIFEILGKKKLLLYFRLYMSIKQQQEATTDYNNQLIVQFNHIY